jgi:hypothetical protein
MPDNVVPDVWRCGGVTGGVTCVVQDVNRSASNFSSYRF